MVCPYQQFGCQVELSPVDMENHISQCSHKRTLSDSQNIYCLFKDIGCTETFHSDEALCAHLEGSTSLHLTMVLKVLPQLSLTQTNANTIATESTLWDPPPKNGAAAAAKSEPHVEWQQLLKNLCEKVVVLEQQNRELSITIANQENQLTALQTSLRFHQEEIFLRSCNGVYIWRLHSFQEKLSSMRNDSLKMFYSPGFYTAPCGYKICVRINVSPKDPEFLSLLLHMMKSENDDGLDWPFNGMIFFTLVHPHSPEKNIREMAASRPDLEAFRKPVWELNKRSFGYTEFVRIHDLTHFLQNDSLVFRIEVRVCDKINHCTPDSFGNRAGGGTWMRSDT